jgi:hypothetical protein
MNIYTINDIENDKIYTDNFGNEVIFLSEEKALEFLRNNFEVTKTKMVPEYEIDNIKREAESTYQGKLDDLIKKLEEQKNDRK